MTELSGLLYLKVEGEQIKGTNKVESKFFDNWDGAIMLDHVEITDIGNNTTVSSGLGDDGKAVSKKIAFSIHSEEKKTLSLMYTSLEKEFKKIDELHLSVVKRDEKGQDSFSAVTLTVTNADENDISLKGLVKDNDTVRGYLDLTFDGAGDISYRASAEAEATDASKVKTRRY